MKKIALILLTVFVTFTLLISCTKTPSTEKEPDVTPEKTPIKTPDDVTDQNSSLPEKPLETITVGASITPHSEILKQCVEILKEKGYELKIVEFTDYVLPNEGVTAKQLDANYFQHQPYLDDYNTQKSTDIATAASIHYEPFGIYAGKTKAVADLKNGAKIAVPNDSTNEARALLLLEAQGLIKLKKDVGLGATKLDIVENTKKFEIVEVEAATLVLTLNDVDIAVINGNYAIQGGLKVKDAIAVEDKESVAATTYANIVACRKGEEKSAKITALVDALKSEKVKKYIEDTYEGAVIPMF